MHDYKQDLIISISMITLGLLFLIIPDVVLNIFFFIIGGIIILLSISNFIILLVNHRNELQEYKAVIILDAILLIVGIVFETLAYFFIFVFIIFLSLILILFGSYGLYASLVDSSLSKMEKILRIIIDCLTIVIGILLIVNINQSINVITYILGGILVINGLLNTLCFIKKIKDNHKEKHSIHEPIDVEINESNQEEK